MEAAQARSPAATSLRDETIGTVIDVGFWQARNTNPSVLVRTDLIKGGVMYLTQWRPLRELLAESSGPQRYKQFTEKYAVPGNVALLRKALIARHDNVSTRVRAGWGKHLRTASRGEPSITLGTHRRYAAGLEPIPHEVECIHWHGYTGTVENPVLFYRVSWKDYADQHVIDTEGEAALHVTADKMDDGPMLRAYQALGQRPRVGADLAPEDAMSHTTPVPFTISPLRDVVTSGTSAPAQPPPANPAPPEDPLLAFLDEPDVCTTACSQCGGLFNVPPHIGHPADACPRAPSTTSVPQQRHAQVAAFMAARDPTRAEALLHLATEEDGIISYPFSQLTPVERAALRAHMATQGQASDPESCKPQADPCDARV